MSSIIDYASLTKIDNLNVSVNIWDDGDVVEILIPYTTGTLLLDERAKLVHAGVTMAPEAVLYVLLVYVYVREKTSLF